MADSELVLNDVLCFLMCKFGKIAIKPLKSSVLDFFKIEDICDAKSQLLRDIQLMNLMDLPHIPDRRAGSDQAVRVVDDIVTILTCVDEQLKMNDLPCYVSRSPDCMPATRLYEGDMAVLMNLLTKLDGHIVNNGSAIAAITSDLCHLREALKSVTTDLTQVRRAVINGACDQRNAAVTAGNSTQSMEQVLNEPADRDQLLASSLQSAPQLDWASAASASLLSSPVVQSNRFAVLDVEGEGPDDRGGDDGQFTEVLSRRAQKRRRQLSAQPSPSQQQSSVVRSTGEPRQNAQRQQQQAKRVMLGISTTVSNSLAAAKPIKKKAVFCLDNISPSYSADDVRAYVTSLSIDVVSCFQVQPRRLRYGANYDRRAFRLCIFDADRGRLLDASKWPDSVIISEWYHKQATNDRQQQQSQQQHRSVSAAGNTVSAGDAMMSAVSTASVVPTTVSVTAQSESVTTDANTMSSATVADDMDTTMLYHDGASTSVVDL